MLGLLIEKPRQWLLPRVSCHNGAIAQSTLPLKACNLVIASIFFWVIFSSDSYAICRLLNKPIMVNSWANSLACVLCCIFFKADISSIAYLSCNLFGQPLMVVSLVNFHVRVSCCIFFRPRPFALFLKEHGTIRKTLHRKNQIWIGLLNEEIESLRKWWERWWGTWICCSLFDSIMKPWEQPYIY